MLTRILRVVSLALFAAAALLAWALHQLGVSLWLAAAIGALLPLAFHGVPLAIEFVAGALIDRRPIRRLGLLPFVRLWWNETWRAFVAFTIDQPWRAAYAEPPLQRDSSHPAVLFVHGYMCNRGIWRPWIAGGRLPSAWNVATLDLEPVFGPVEGYAALFKRAVDELRRATGAGKVTLVCHSMGGLAARAYLRAFGPESIARVITIDTPHHGTVFARFGRGVNTRQMGRACDYIRRLAEQDEAVEFICFASHHDNLVVPRDSQVLECAESVWFDGIGHLAMTADDRVLAKVIAVVERPLPAATPLPSAVSGSRARAAG